MAGPNIGEKVYATDAQRDAIHVAVIPLTAGDDHMRSGDSIRLSLEDPTVALGLGEYGNSIGVVDPFLDDYIKKGDRFWAFLTPGTVTGMQHKWQHPAFDDFKEPSGESELWLRQFADKWNFNFSELISAGLEEEWSYVIAQGKDLHSESELDPGDADLFWRHLAEYTGHEAFSDEHKESMKWSCTC